MAVGASQNDTVSFTHREIKADVKTKSFGSGESPSSAIDDLLSPHNTELRVKPGQEGLISGLAGPVITGLLPLLPDLLLSELATPIDGVLDATLTTLGAQLGAGELIVTRHHCEPIRLVR